jgi:hypothetical protein
MTLCPGQIFGEETLINLANTENEPQDVCPLYTIRCKSALGEVLILAEDEFEKKILTSSKTLNMIVDNCDAKAKRCQALLSNECSYINPVTAWKRLEEDARK